MAFWSIEVCLAAFAAAPPSDQLFQSVLPWALALIGLAVVGALVLLVLRRMFRRVTDHSVEGFTLQGLRDLRDRGELTDEEFERARQVMIGHVKASDKGPRPGETGDASAGGRTAEATPSNTSTESESAADDVRTDK